LRIARRPILALATSLLLAGCRRDAGKEPERTLTVAVRSDVTGIFPNAPMTNDSYTLDVNANVFEGLVRLDAQLVPQPAIALRWENPDALTWVFRLRPGIRFSDGTPVTAGDVVASLQAARELHWCNEGALPAIESVSAPDDATVRLRTRVPFPNLLPRLHYAFVLPAAAVRRLPVPAVGTGPFVVERWEPGVALTLVRSETFRGPPSTYSRIRFEVVPLDADRVARVTSGGAQLADTVPLAEVARLEKDASVRMIVQPGLRVVFLAPRLDREPFSDERVRAALDLAIDREELIRNALGGRGYPATQLVTPAVFGYDRTRTAAPADRVRARKLLAEAGHPDGLAVRLECSEKMYAGAASLLREVVRQLGEAGLRVEVKPLPKDAWNATLTSGSSPLYLYGWACETLDAGDALDALTHTRTADGLGANNFQGLSDGALDALVDEAGRAPDVASRRALFERALARVAEKRFVVPLVIQPETLLSRRDLVWDPPLNLGLRLLETARSSSSK